MTVLKNEEGKWVVELEDEYVPQLRISQNYVRMMQRNPDAENEGLHQAEGRGGQVADRVDRAAVQHAQAGRPGDRRRADRLSRKRPRRDRPAENAADRRRRRRACHDGLAGGRRQVDADAARRVRPEALLRRRHDDGGRRGSRLGEHPPQAQRDHRRRGQIESALGRRPRGRTGQAGYELARRTVTKYRKAMDIPSSRQRREY